MPTPPAATRSPLHRLPPLLLALLLLGAGQAWASRPAGRAVEVTGRLEVHHADRFAEGRSSVRYFLRTPEGRLPLWFEGRPPLALAGMRVRVEGRLVGRTVRVPSGDRSVRAVTRGPAVGRGGGTGGAATREAAAEGTAAAPVTRSVAVLMFNFSNNPSTPWTAAQARAVMFDNPDSIRAYFEEESFGQVAVTGEVYGWYTIPDTDAGCDYTGWASAARSAATAAGVSLSGYQHIVYAFPRTGSCGWAGLAYVRGRDSWANGQMNLYVIGHELSHNLGVHHASSLRCTEGGVSVPLSSTCTVSEYGDPFSIMGQSGTRHSHNWHLGQMGWIRGAEVQTVTAPGTYWLGPADFADSGVKAIRVPRGSQYLYLELRRPYGTYFDNFSPRDPAVNGVTVRLAPDFPTVTQSRLVDANPSTTTFADAPLAPGQVLSDPQYGITILTQSVSSTGAVVQVSFGADTTPPTAPTDLVARATSGSSVSLTWSPSSDDQSVAGYRVWRDGAVLGTTASTGYTDSGLAPETTYTYSVQAYDAAGNWSPPATATATTSAGDRTAPTAPTGLSGRRVRAGRVALAWGPSTDDVGVAGYRVYRNDALVVTVTATGYTDRPPRRVTATYYVVAFDAAGNVSARSNSVTL